MTSTISTVFSTAVTDCFVNNVASHLSDWLKNNKSVEVSTEEICGAFNVPYTPRPVYSGLPQSASTGARVPNLPGHLQGTGASPAKKGGRKKKASNPDGPGCKYQFQRGANKGKECGTTVLGDGSPGSDEYCKACLSKKTVQSSLAGASGAKSTVQPPVMPGGKVAIVDQESSAGLQLNVEVIQGHDNMYRDTSFGYIIQKRDDESLVALAIEENGVQRGLTDAEKNHAQSLGLNLIAETVKSVSPVIPTPVQTAPTIPQVASIPQALPSHTPQIPAVPQVMAP